MHERGFNMADILGYARVSTQEQNLDRQIDALVSAGACRKHLYCEKITGTKSDRPELNRLIHDLEEGDTVITAHLTRISRSTKTCLISLNKLRIRVHT